MSLPLLTLLLAAFPPAGEAKEYAQPKLLIEPAALAKIIEEKTTIVILDARPKKEYEAGHVPGAIWINAETWAKTFHSTRDSIQWGMLLGHAGIAGSLPLKAQIVIYDDSKAKDAARIWWIMRYWNIKNVRLLNGGWKGWESGNFPKSKMDHVVKETIFIVPTGNAKLQATKEDVLQNLKSKTAQLIDARSEGEYCGDVKMAKKGGAIPGALNLEWSDAIDPKTQRFKPASELAKLLKDKGINLDSPIITHCQSGGRAAVMQFTLELMGAKNVSNYYAGWSEWGNAAETPIVTPKKK